MEKIPSQEEMAEKLKYAVVVPPVERDWPTIAEVQERYPELCMEEQEWILETLIAEAHRRKHES